MSTEDQVAKAHDPSEWHELVSLIRQLDEDRAAAFAEYEAHPYTAEVKERGEARLSARPDPRGALVTLYLEHPFYDGGSFTCCANPQCTPHGGVADRMSERQHAEHVIDLMVSHR